MCLLHFSAIRLLKHFVDELANVKTFCVNNLIKRESRYSLINLPSPRSNLSKTTNVACETVIREMGEGGVRGKCERAPATVLWLLNFGFIRTKY